MMLGYSRHSVCWRYSASSRTKLTIFPSLHLASGMMQAWLAEAGGRGETLRYKTHAFNNNGAHETHSR